MEQWISVKDSLPDSTNQNDSFWIYAGQDIFFCGWVKIDCIGDDEKKLYDPTAGYWFGYQDGTECFSAFENVTHWMPIIPPLPPNVEISMESINACFSDFMKKKLEYLKKKYNFDERDLH